MHHIEQRLQMTQIFEWGKQLLYPTDGQIECNQNITNHL